ncbi:MAG TPA: hypothetical protein VF367_04770 [Candidatus Limnocylindria bacterium]
MRRPTRWTVLLVAAALVLLAPAAVILLAGTAQAPTASPPPPSVLTSSRPDPSHGALDLGAAWWRRDANEMGLPRVRIGTLAGGETAVIDLRVRDDAVMPATHGPNRRVGGPVDGYVAIIEDDGPHAVLSTVDAASGRIRELLRREDLIIDVARAGDELVILTVDPADGTPTGVWRLAPDGEAQPIPIEGLIGQAPDVRLAAVVDWMTRLVVSTDGRVIAIHRCVQLACELRAIDIGSGEAWRHRLDWVAQPEAVIGRMAVLNHACVDVDCRQDLLDLESGAIHPLLRSDPMATRDIAVTTTPDTVVSIVSGPPVAPGGRPQEPVVIDVYDFAEGIPRQVPLELGSLRLVTPMFPDAGIEAPEGTFLALASPVMDGGDVPPAMSYVLVDVRRATAQFLEILGDVIVQE